MYQLFEDMHRSLKQLNDLIDRFEAKLEFLPEGSLTEVTKGKRNYYYHNLWTGGKKHNFYLKESEPLNKLLISQLKQRRFILAGLPVLKDNAAALAKALKKFRPYDPAKIADGLAPVYQDIKEDSALWLPDAPDLKKWIQTPYEKSSSHPEALIHETVCGIMVRSKSEAMIADTLSYFQIPFRYEQLLTANGNIYAPDFTALRPKDRKLMYWEHFGLMDNPEYVLSNANKLLDYRAEGIRASDNFIATFEDKKRPLSMREIYDTVTARLL